MNERLKRKRMMTDMRQLTRSTSVVALIVPFRLASLWASYGPGHIVEFVPWLAAGWTCVACGLVARRTAPWSFEAILLVAAGVAWLLPDVSSCLNVEPLSHRCVGPIASASLAGVVGWLWLGVLGHAIIAFPEGRLAGVSMRLAVGTAYVLAVAIGVGSMVARPLLAALLIAAPILQSVFRRDRDVPALVAPTIASVALAVVVLLGSGPAYALEVGVVVAAMSLLAGLATITSSRAALTADRAVELGSGLADVLGDPTFRIAVRDSDGTSWLPTSDLVLPAPSTGRASTAIVRDGIEIARIFHDESTLADPEIRAAVVTAVELEAHNVRLRADLDMQASDIASSRRRLVDAGLREREAIGRQVEVEVMGRLDHLAHAVDSVSTDGLPADAVEGLGRAAGAIAVARVEVEDLARGVYPPALAERGLVGALRELAATTPMDVRIEPNDGADGEPEAVATLYFVCAEAIANASRHARASSVRIDVVRRPAEFEVRIEDDGAGGADLDHGTGLRGLRDRVEALGGTFQIESAPGMGTRLVATVPVGHEAT